jgi:hypothetical protein
MNEIGITERGDVALDLGWLPWVQKGKPAILITKDPRTPGFGRSVLEPYVSDKFESLTAYKQLICVYGIDRVVLRIDR